ncbi:MAG: hypothetical protein R3F04_03105 [Lysobacteraceae bacterium]|mgnify:CR=1 FL=1
MNYDPNIVGERMIDSRQASNQFNLPLHWFVNLQERHRRGIPYYRIGSLIRFKASDLALWMESKQPSTDGSEAGHA